MYGLHNVKFIMQPGSTAAGRPVTTVPAVMHDFYFELPVDGECELNNLEQKLQDKQQLHSLVNVL